MASILGQRKDYTRYYGDFRGVDFSSDHTQVNERRLAYLVNMYKDYQSGQGYAIETVPGFRRRFEVEGEKSPVYGIHEIKFGNDVASRLLVHIGKYLYLWDDSTKDVGIIKEKNIVLEDKHDKGESAFCIDFAEADTVRAVIFGDTELSYTFADKKIAIENSELKKNNIVTVRYYEIKTPKIIFADMSEAKSSSFIMNNKLFILDGQNYLYYDGENLGKVSEHADCYIPTTYINIIPSGENADGGKEFQQRNLLSPYFKNTFYADGENKSFKVKEDKIEGIEAVKVYGKTYTESTGYTAENGFPENAKDNIYGVNGNEVIFLTAPKKPEDENFPENHAGVEITAKKARDATEITNCTIAATFDDRVFLAGNPALPNRVYWSVADNPFYFPENSWVSDGVGIAPITGMLAVADTLMVLKSDTQQDGAVYFHTAEATGDDLYPKTYPNTRGLAGIGCLGACTNFLDDPVFVSRLGVEAVGQLSVRYERAIEHRSSLIDAKLLNFGADKLTKASICEWNGYLVLLVDGKIFLADSRQRYTHDIGVMQYEWYYLEDIGVWDGQYLGYRYAKSIDDDIKVLYEDKEYSVELAPEKLRGTLVNAPKSDGTKSATIYDNGNGVFYVVENGKAYLCNTYGEMIGGTFHPATVVKTIGDNLFFGTENGVICSFNFDKHNEFGEIPVTEYTFDGRTIFSGCATKMDNCDIPHLTKSTVKKSTIIKTRSMQISAAKIKVRTNNKPYEQIGRINSTIFSFEDMLFDDFSFITLDQSLFSIKEKEKKWVEKQYYVYSDEYMRPFSLYYVTYRYCVAGRYKE